jgi:O-antigen/teichoic acid export membrane protein
MAGYMIRSGLPLLPHSLSVALSGQADKLFVTRIMGAASLAKYSVVHSLGIALQFAVTSIGSALGPWIIRRLDRGEKEKINRVVTTLFTLFCALSLGLCSVAPEAMRLLAPSKYLEALPALFPIAISTPTALISYVTTVSLVHSGHGKYTAVISGINLGLCIILNYTLISSFGYLGAGLALLFSQLICTLLGYVALKSIGLSDMLSPMRVGGYLSFTIIVGFVTNLLYSNSILRWVLLIIPGIWGILQLFKCKDLVMEAK